jgi:hypothetical protein
MGDQGKDTPDFLANQRLSLDHPKSEISSIWKWAKLWGVFLLIQSLTIILSALDIW